MSRSVTTPSGMPCASTTGICPQSFSIIIRATSRSGVCAVQQAGLAVITEVTLDMSVSLQPSGYGLRPQLRAAGVFPT